MGNCKYPFTGLLSSSFTVFVAIIIFSKQMKDDDDDNEHAVQSEESAWNARSIKRF